MSNKPEALFRRRRQRVRFRVRLAAKGRARLSVFRSSRHIYAQIIDDQAGRTLAAASTLDATVKPNLKTGADTAAASAGRASSSPSGPRRPASSASSSTAAPICFTAGSRRWPTPPARAACEF